MSNSLRDYKSNFRSNLPSGMTYDSAIARFLVNNHRFVAPWFAENYIDRIIRFGFSTDAWNVSAAVFSQSFSLSAQVTSPSEVFFKPDGTKMYILDYGADDVSEYDLSTAWDISTATYVQNFSVSSQETSPYALFFKPDGTKMYVLGTISDSVNEYDLSTAWDISTASYLQAKDVGAQDTSFVGLFFKPDGTKMYVLGYSGQDVNEYDLSTAWDVTSATYTQNFSVSSQESLPDGLFFKPDGTKMYVSGGSSDNVNEYDLSTPWDISTAAYLQNFDVSAKDTYPESVHFKPDGTKMYITGSSDAVHEYNLGT